QVSSPASSASTGESYPLPLADSVGVASDLVKRAPRPGLRGLVARYALRSAA
ncbi:unnamed protein product, partial [Musa textilis]